MAVGTSPLKAEASRSFRLNIRGKSFRRLALSTKVKKKGLLFTMFELFGLFVLFFCVCVFARFVDFRVRLDSSLSFSCFSVTPVLLHVRNLRILAHPSSSLIHRNRCGISSFCVRGVEAGSFSHLGIKI